MRIGILGGTFNPVHLGHLNLARESKRILKLQRVIFIPVKIPPHKKTAVAAARHRLKMLRLAIKGRPGFSVSLLEFSRRGKSYSVDTIKALRKIYACDELFFITGADSITELKTWKQINKIFNLCTFVVADRPGFEVKRPAGKIKIIAIRRLDVSSHHIRALLRRGRSINGLVPQAVKRYIRGHRLYGPRHGKSNSEQ